MTSPLKKVSYLSMVLFLSQSVVSFGQTFTDRTAFEDALEGSVRTIDFEGIAQRWRKKNGGFEEMFDFPRKVVGKNPCIPCSSCRGGPIRKITT